ncbi:MAG: penicillin-binding protein 1C [Bdellovibrio sp.]|nr:MAG: penicillin-binding protein 1C [Bdellovibrio sp.]
MGGFGTASENTNADFSLSEGRSSVKKKTLRIFLVSGIATFILYLSLLQLTPSFQEVLNLSVGSDRVLLDRRGQLLQTLRTDFGKRRFVWAPLDSFSEDIKAAVLLSEDRRFFNHWGVDAKGLGRSAVANLKKFFRSASLNPHQNPHQNLQSGAYQGASTLTMQLADLIQPEVLNSGKPIKKGSIIHKVSQIFRAVGIEWRWTKEQILEAYLNLIHLRGEYQGVPAMAQAYFKKYPLALGRGESAVIAALISSPNQGPHALKTKAWALAKSLAGKEDCEEIDPVLHQIFQENASIPPAQMGSAPHLARRLSREFPHQAIFHSSLDLDVQQKVAAILDKNIGRLRDRHVDDSAALVIENRTGKVLAYVGAVSSSENPHVDGVTAMRQAGSTLKPFVYGRALERKLVTPASVLLDDPIAITWSEGTYRPTNYDLHFNGPVSVREALASSLNVPAVKVVTMLGLPETYQVLKGLHFTGLKDSSFYGVSMVLGAVEVKLEELTNAYRILANGGRWSKLSFDQTEDNTRGTAEVPPQETVYSEEVAFMLSSILSDPNARTMGFGWSGPLETPFWTAVKTGTSKDYRDNWCVGFSEKYTVGVWTGNFDATAMEKVSGVTGSGPSWYEIMAYLHEHERSHPPPVPAGLVARQIQHPWHNFAETEFFLKGTEPLQTKVVLAPERVEFSFPSEGSVLAVDPHLPPEKVGLFARFRGKPPAGSMLWLDDQALGPAASPFFIRQISDGYHRLAIESPERGRRSRHGDRSIVTEVHFRMIGGYQAKANNTRGGYAAHAGSLLTDWAPFFTKPRHGKIFKTLPIMRPAERFSFD